MDDSTAKRLVQVLRRFDGVISAELADGRLAIAFEQTRDGEVAELVWLRAAERFKLESIQDTWAVNDQQGRGCLRVMAYASAEHFSNEDYVPSRDAGKDVGRSNLFQQLATAYTAIEDQIERSADLPFNAWANGLRVLSAQPVEQSEFVRRAILSQRAVRVVLRDLIALNWITVEGGGKHQRICLTAEGGAARRRIERATATVSSGLEEAVGKGAAAKLQHGMTACIRSMAYELPWGLTGYGPGDGSPTGGRYVAAQTAPHFVPWHGAEWPVVPRRPGEALSDVPLLTLLAKTLTRFMIDYEHLNVGSVVDGYAAQEFPDDGLPLPEAKRSFDVAGTGRSGRERHFFIVTPIGRSRNRLAHLTPKGKTERDALGWALERIEDSWRNDLGAAILDELQFALSAALDHLPRQSVLEPRLRTTRWFAQLHQLAIAAI